MNLENIILVDKCVLVKRDEPLKQTASGIILGENFGETINTGVIVKLGIEAILDGIDNNTLLGQRIRFKEAFAEELDIEGEKYLFFRNLEPSIYYFIKNEKNKE